MAPYMALHEPTVPWNCPKYTIWADMEVKVPQILRLAIGTGEFAHEQELMPHAAAAHLAPPLLQSIAVLLSDSLPDLPMAPVDAS